MAAPVPTYVGNPTRLLRFVTSPSLFMVVVLFGAIVGCAKDDIKKTLAASTMSQIGYMMLAAGLGPIGYAFAIFHLVTHGFFKAGMFLGAGSVMHGMSDQVDMRRFGGLGRYMKVTWITFGLGWLAILGVPPFSGFWSKDKIIESAFATNEATGWQPWVFGGVALCRHIEPQGDQFGEHPGVIARQQRVAENKDRDHGGDHFMEQRTLQRKGHGVRPDTGDQKCVNRHHARQRGGGDAGRHHGRAHRPRNWRCRASRFRSCESRSPPWRCRSSAWNGPA